MSFASGSLRCLRHRPLHPRVARYPNALAKLVYRGMLKPIGSGVVSKYRAIKELRNVVKEGSSDEFESSSEEEDNNDMEEDSGDELVVEEEIDFFGQSGAE